MRVELLHGCWQDINEDDRLVTTHFGDGLSLVAACPTVDDPKWDEHVARANALGYKVHRTPAGRTYEEEIVWLMTKDHDRIHMELAQAEGSFVSPTLHLVACGTHWTDDDRAMADREERRVFYIQRVKNMGLE